jgi:hypothetical protein
MSTDCDRLVIVGNTGYFPIYSFKIDGKEQTVSINDNLFIMTGSDYFCPVDYKIKSMTPPANTYSITLDSS